MSTDSVDVNVHPSKLEVKFSDERPVFESVYYTVKRAIEDYNYRPSLNLEKKQNAKNPIGAFVPIGVDTKGEQIRFTDAPRANIKEYNFKLDKCVESIKDTKEADGFNPPLSVAAISNSSTYRNEEGKLTAKESIAFLEKYRTAVPEEKHTADKTDKAESAGFSEERLPEYKIIGEVFDCYVMVECERALLVIDKHAAHERIIFEDLKRSRADDGRIASQELLLPITVLLSAEEIASANDFTEELHSIGFELDINDRSIDIKAIPEAINARDAEGLLVSMLGELSIGVGNPQNTEKIRRERALYQIACKAAIKGGRVYDRSIIEWLVKRILAIPDITVCPHGRPIAYKLTKTELDRQFDRIK